MKKDLRLNFTLQLFGVVLMAGFGWLFWLYFTLARPALSDELLQFKSAPQPTLLVFSLLLLVTLAVWMTAHELVHGAFFWWFSRHRPQFGYGFGYLYAAMPGWYFPKWPYLAVGLAPLVVLSLVGMLLVPFLPVFWAGLAFFGMVVNASGAVGDIYVCFRIGLEARDVLICDRGDGFEVFRPAAR